MVGIGDVNMLMTELGTVLREDEAPLPDVVDAGNVPLPRGEADVADIDDDDDEDNCERTEEEEDDEEEDAKLSIDDGVELDSAASEKSSTKSRRRRGRVLF